MSGPNDTWTIHTAGRRAARALFLFISLGLLRYLYLATLTADFRPPAVHNVPHQVV